MNRENEEQLENGFESFITQFHSHVAVFILPRKEIRRGATLEEEDEEKEEERGNFSLPISIFWPNEILFIYKVE